MDGPAVVSRLKKLWIRWRRTRPGGVTVDGVHYHRWGSSEGMETNMTSWDTTPSEDA